MTTKLAYEDVLNKFDAASVSGKYGGIYVILVNPDTGLPYAAGGGGGGGGGDASSANQTAVIGSKAAGTAAAASQLTGGVYNAANPSLATGQQVALQVTSGGLLKVALYTAGGAGPDILVGSADGGATPNGKLAVASFPYVWNGATSDRLAGNTKGLFTTQSPQAGTSRSLAVPSTAPASGNLFPANATRSRYLIQNNGAAALWISFGGIATVGGLDSMLIGPGQFYAGDSDTVAISAISASGTINVFAREW